VVVFWGVVMGGIAIVMLLAGGDGDEAGEALSGIQSITIIMAAPFALVMVLLCVALSRDLRHDPLMQRAERSQEAVGQAVEYGTRAYGEDFRLSVKRASAAAGTGAEGPGPTTDGAATTGARPTGSSAAGSDRDRP
jgi:choline-glycine betaine transporter